MPFHQAGESEVRGYTSGSSMSDRIFHDLALLQLNHKHMAIIHTIDANSQGSISFVAQCLFIFWTCHANQIIKMSTVQGLTGNLSGSTNCFSRVCWWKNDYGYFASSKEQTYEAFLWTYWSLHLIIFWLNDCVFKRNGTFGPLAYHAYLNFLRISKAWLPSPMRRLFFSPSNVSRIFS